MDLAHSIGYEVGRRDCVVLSGGAGPIGDTVKNQVLAGANSAAKEGALAPWIGVPKFGDGEPPADLDSARSYRLNTGLGDERNYLEALLCDVAIAIAGGDGTASEVAFCVALGRPTVLVGSWSKVLPPSRPEDRIAYLATSIDRRVLRRRIDPDLRSRIESAKADLTGGVFPQGGFSLNDKAAGLVDRAMAAAGPIVQRGFPGLSVLSPYRSPYLNWIRSIDTRLRRL